MNSIHISAYIYINDIQRHGKRSNWKSPAKVTQIDWILIFAISCHKAYYHKL